MQGKFPEKLVSVVIAVYNGERYIGQAIESVLEQSHSAIDLIVVDDGSNDGTAGAVRAYGDRLRYVRQENAGQSAAVNWGITLARGNYLAFLDADDLWTKTKLERQLAALESEPAADLVFGHVEQFISPDLDEVTASRLHCPSGQVPGYQLGTLLTTTSVIARAGQFSTRWRAGQFMDWLFRANDLGLRSVMLPDLVLRRRIHGANQGLTQPAARSDYAKVLKEALDRRRAIASNPPDS